MLRKFTVNNFKSLVNVTYEPGMINVLIGVNSTGKSNLCQALHFLSRLARSRGRSLFRVWQGVVGRTPPELAKNVYFDYPTMDLGCTCQLIVAGEPLTFDYSLVTDPEQAFSVKVETLRVSGGDFGSDSMTLLNNERGNIRLLDEECYLRKGSVEESILDTSMHGDTAMLPLLYDKKANQRAMVFRDYLAQWQFYDLAPHRLRDDRFDPHADFLKPDGSNLVSALYHLKNRDEIRNRRLIEMVQTIEQRIDNLNFAMVGDYIQMEPMDAQGHRFNIASISDGALRFMALCHIILNNPPRPNPPLIVIEEPEDALYVPKLQPLLQALDTSGDSGQFIFTSHSLYLIPMLSEHLQNIVIMQDMGTHSVLTRPDLTEARQYIEQIPIDKLYPENVKSKA